MAEEWEMKHRVERAIWDAFTASKCWPAELKGVTLGGARLIAESGDAPFVSDYMDAIKSMADAAIRVMDGEPAEDTK